MQSRSTRSFLKRYGKKVNEIYLLTPSEIKQKLSNINLFEKFDVDGSGTLDSHELTSLYN